MPTNSSFETAQLISNPLNTTQLSGQLNSQESAFYKLVIGASSSAINTNISLTDLTGNADLKVYDANRNLLSNSIQSSQLSESFIRNGLSLTSGTDTYYIQVSYNQPQASVGYNLNVSVNTNANLNNIIWRNTAAEANAIWEMNGKQVGSWRMFDLPSSWKIEKIADVNGDGNEDAIWRNQANGAFAIWWMRGKEILDYKLFDPLPLEWKISHTGDFNNDGSADLEWYNTVSNDTAIWLMSTTEIGVSDYGVFQGFTNWYVDQVGDLDRDGKVDNIWRNRVTGDVSLVMMDGKTPGNYRLLSPGTNWKIESLADLNGDRRKDLVWRNTANGDVAFWIMNGLEVSNYRVVNIGLNWKILGIADFNGDRRDDLIWQSSNGDVMLNLANTDGVSFTYPNAPLITLPSVWKLDATKDFNNDGKADLLWRNAPDNVAAVWLMNGWSVQDYELHTVPSSWAISGLFGRQTTSAPFSIGGPSPDTAFNIGILNDSGSYTDVVRSTASDYFKFAVTTPTDFTMNTTSGSTLQLFQETPGEAPTEVPYNNTMLLETGTYLIKVSTTATQNTPYTLNVTGIPRIVNPVAAAFNVTLPQSGQLALQGVDSNGMALNPNTVNATFRIENAELYAVKDFKVSFYISRDATIDPSGSTGDVQVGVSNGSTGTSIVGKDLVITRDVSRNSAFDGTVTLTLPASTEGFWLTDRDYYLGIVIDRLGEIGEVNENDNFNVAFGRDKLTLPVIEVPTTDLRGRTLSAPTMTLQTPQSGPYATYTNVLPFSFENIGNRATPTGTTLNVKFFLSTDATIDINTDLLIGDISDIPALGGKATNNAIYQRNASLYIPSKSTWSEFSALNNGMHRFYIGMYVDAATTSGLIDVDLNNNLNRGNGIDVIAVDINVIDGVPS